MGKWMDGFKAKKAVSDGNSSTPDANDASSATTMEDQADRFLTPRKAINPTPFAPCVPDGVKVSGALPDTSRHLASFPVPDRVKVSGTLPDTSELGGATGDTPVAYCRYLVKHRVELLQDLPTREEAVSRLVSTFRPEIREAQLERWTMTMLDGASIMLASPHYRRVEALGIMAWALDRENAAPFNRGAWEWIQAAGAALGRRDPVAAPTPASAYRARAVREYVAALPKDERMKAFDQIGTNLIDGGPAAQATPEVLRADAKALRACAREWRAGRPSDPASHLPLIPTLHHAGITPSAYGASKHGRP
jgi:hypothetical protein